MESPGSLQLPVDSTNTIQNQNKALDVCRGNLFVISDMLIYLPCVLRQSLQGGEEERNDLEEEQKYEISESMRVEMEYQSDRAW